MTDDWKKYLDNPDYEIRIHYTIEPMPLSHNHFTDVIICSEGIPMRIPLNEWKEREEYVRLKRKWSWLD